MIQIRIKLFLTAIFWGGTFIAGRVVTKHMGPFSAAFLRFFIASVFLVAFTWKTERKIPLLTQRQMLFLSLLGLSGIFAYNYFFFSGLKSVHAGRAAIIIANNPIFISLFSVIIFREKVTALKVMGILLSVSGAIWALSRGDLELITGQFGLGEFYIFMCVVSFVVYTMVGKAVMVNLSPLVSVTYSSVIGTLLLVFPATQEGMWGQLAGFNMTAWLNVFYLGFFGTVLGFIWYYEGIKNLGPMKASIFINFVPISAIILSYFILKEPITVSLFGGAILVIMGVYLTNVSRIRQLRSLT
ncbi:MAG: EamA family transporter [Calditrichae bacterium]|nr:EamA family transporter [Calditrichia bacterium]